MDGLAWVGGLAFETLTRMGLAASGVNWRGLAVVSALAVSLQTAGGNLTRLYLGRRVTAASTSWLSWRPPPRG